MKLCLKNGMQFRAREDARRKTVSPRYNIFPRTVYIIHVSEVFLMALNKIPLQVSFHMHTNMLYFYRLLPRCIQQSADCGSQTWPSFRMLNSIHGRTRGVHRALTSSLPFALRRGAATHQRIESTNFRIPNLSGVSPSQFKLVK